MSATCQPAAVPEPATPVASPEAPLTLAQVNAGVSARIRAIPQMWLTGEVIRCDERGRSVYLTLADPDVPRGKQPPELTGYMDSRDFRALPVEPTAGARIVAFATLSYWHSKSKVAATLTDVRLAGEGAVLERIEVLRQALAAEGLFDPTRKKPLPAAPALIGLITGQGSHAELDVLTRTKERWPAARFRVIHAPMQGVECAPAVTAGIKELDADDAVAVIVVARGGGAISELAPFSDERLVRAVAACTTPIVSAIGHEPDKPILDDVADERAGSPTHAAALVAPDVVGNMRSLTADRDRLRRAVHRHLHTAQRDLDITRSRSVLTDPHFQVNQHAVALERAAFRARRAIQHQVSTHASGLTASAGALRALSPLAVSSAAFQSSGAPTAHPSAPSPTSAQAPRSTSARSTAT
ncbi:exodeoxyribonuclease VII large subunit [Cellulomonas sp.]|uniref:exodeoxyribonuclease VII large subunit n=1 Tax=Cellulomonas sp. TaxID=40001 RepID=UPI003BAC612F